MESPDYVSNKPFGKNMYTKCGAVKRDGGLRRGSGAVVATRCMAVIVGARGGRRHGLRMLWWRRKLQEKIPSVLEEKR